MFRNTAVAADKRNRLLGCFFNSPQSQKGRFVGRAVWNEVDGFKKRALRFIVATEL